jgi:hypothetical protein
MWFFRSRGGLYALCRGGSWCHIWWKESRISIKIFNNFLHKFLDKNETKNNQFTIEIQRDDEILSFLNSIQPSLPMPSKNPPPKTNSFLIHDSINKLALSLWLHFFCEADHLFENALAHFNDYCGHLIAFTSFRQFIRVSNWV